MNLSVLGAGAIRDALSMSDAIDAMEEAFGALAEGRVELPLRTAVELTEIAATTLFMPARVSAGAPGAPGTLGGKIVSVFPENAGRGLPTIHGLVVLLDAETGQPAALLEGATLTALRTGAASGLATRVLARPESSAVAVIGAGRQARTQLAAVRAVRPIRRVTIHSRTRAHAERFAREVAQATRAGHPAEGDPPAVQVCDSVRAATAEADIICVATSAAEPVLAADDVAMGTHINAIGSYTPDMIEVEPALVGRCRLVVDQRDAALAEAGEVIAALHAGLLADAEIGELGAIVLGREPGRRAVDEITLFKSVGLAVQDLCAARAALERARAAGLGERVEL